MPYGACEAVEARDRRVGLRKDAAGDDHELEDLLKAAWEGSKWPLLALLGHAR